LAEVIYSYFKAIAGCLPGSAHRARSARNELRANCPDFIPKDQWPPNSPNIYPIDYRVWGAMLEAYCKLKTKPKAIAKVKETLQVIWGNLPQRPIYKVVKNLSNKAIKCFCWSLKLAVNTSNIYSDNEILASDYWLTVLFQRCY